MSFSETSLSKKFTELNSRQQSVQTLSLWLIHHRKHAKSITKCWLRELVASPQCERKLTFIYLANDILQNSRKKGQEYATEFASGNIINEAIKDTAKYADTKIRFTLERILNIWKERKILPDEKIASYKKVLHATPQTNINNNENSEKNESENSINSPSPTKNNYTPSNSSPESAKKKQKHINSTTEIKTAPNQIKAITTSLRDEVLKELEQKKLKEEGVTNNDLLLVLNNKSNNSNDFKDALKLAEMLDALSEEAAASSDATVRGQIANLSPKVSDVTKINGVTEANNQLNVQVDSAIDLLDNYNGRLQQELVSRKQTAVRMALFLREQKIQLEKDEKLVEEWQEKHRQVLEVRNGLDEHLESLPDLSSIDEAAELVPLPSAGDLFSSNQT